MNKCVRNLNHNWSGKDVSHSKTVHIKAYVIKQELAQSVKLKLRAAVTHK